MVALAVAAPLAGAGVEAASAATGGQVGIAITSISPQIAKPGHRITVSGIVTNPTGQAMSALSVQLQSASTPLVSRGDLSSYAAGNLQVATPVPGALRTLPGTVGPGQTVSWTISVPVRTIGLTSFGVYPLAAQVDAGTQPLNTDRTFLPFWPKTASAQPAKLKIAWIWPLIDPPHQGACQSLLSNSLAGSLSASGRLGGLLAAGGSSAGRRASLTWAIDPSLLSSARLMTRPYRVGGNATCGGTVGKPASSTARSWLNGVRSVTGRQDFFATPYADVDVAALTHQGMDSDLSRSFNEGRTVATHILGAAQRPAVKEGKAGGRSGASGAGGAPGTGYIAWPSGGTADYGVLGSLAVNGIGTVVLGSNEMPASSPLAYTPSATPATALTPIGAQLHVALADSTLSQMLGAAGGGSPGAAFAVDQRFLAETAMIVAQAPNLRRTLVVAPPRQWDPSPGLAAALLSATDNAPWLTPTSLSKLVTAKQSARHLRLQRRQPPQQQVSNQELSRSLLRRVRSLDAQIKVQGSIFGDPSYLRPAIAAIESSAWRGTGQAHARALLAAVSRYVDVQQGQIKIDTAHDTLGGRSGPVPVSIINKLDRTVTVKLRVRAPSSRMTILPFKSVITIGRHQQRTVAVRVRASAQGSTTLRVSLLSPNGKLLPGSTAPITVTATHFGTLALVIIGIAFAMFLIGSAVRAIRRGRRGDADSPADEGDDPGQDSNGADRPVSPNETDTVVSGAVTDNQIPEEPDEYASAPGRADHP